MAEPRPVPPLSRLPTLTEVVSEGQRPVGLSAPPRAPEPVDESHIVDSVMVGLQQRVDQMFEFRLREALGPVLARAADLVVQDARQELAHTLRDVVARAVTQELARRRQR